MTPDELGRIYHDSLLKVRYKNLGGILPTKSLWDNLNPGVRQSYIDVAEIASEEVRAATLREVVEDLEKATEKSSTLPIEGLIEHYKAQIPTPPRTPSDD